MAWGKCPVPFTFFAETRAGKCLYHWYFLPLFCRKLYYVSVWKTREKV